LPKFPDPEYINDPITGTIFKEGDRYSLALGDLIPSGETFAQGEFLLRYAIPTLSPPIRWIVPGLMVGERGGAFVGRKAWDYMQDRWEHHPRADVVGLDPEGEKKTYFLKELDLSAKVRTYVFRNAEDAIPFCLLDSYVAPENAELPELMAKYLPRLAP